MGTLDYHRLVKPEVKFQRMTTYREHRPDSPVGTRLGCSLCAPSSPATQPKEAHRG